MDAPTLTADPLTLRPLRPEDRAARRRHGWHAEIERAYGSSTGTRAMTDDELERWSADWERGASEPNRIHWVLDVGGEAVGAAFLHGVDPVDRRARATYRACGFVEEGRERETCFLDGRWHDDVVMAVLEHEFDSSTAG